MERKNNIDFFMTVVNQTFEQSKNLSWVETVRFIVLLTAKIGAFAGFFWILRHI